jgi:hypothetical protein
VVLFGAPGDGRAAVNPEGAERLECGLDPGPPLGSEPAMLRHTKRMRPILSPGCAHRVERGDGGQDGLGRFAALVFGGPG